MKKRIVFPHSTHTAADGLDIVTRDLIVGDEIDRHTLGDKLQPFVLVVCEALSEMLFTPDVITKRFRLNNTPFVIQRGGGGFTVFIKQNQQIADVLLVAAGMLLFEVEDIGTGYRFV